MASFQALLADLRIVPVLTVYSVGDALDCCRALSAGGIKTAEITLRTDVGLECIAAVKEAMPEFVIGAGTIKSVSALEAVIGIGVDFAVSPGLDETLVRRAQESGLHFLPGIATATELMQGLSLGLDCFKQFPAEAVGGRKLLQSLAAPFPEAWFCPTGGINPDNYRDYLALPNVLCVGGSWMASQELIDSRDWEAVTRLSMEAMQGPASESA